MVYRLIEHHLGHVQRDLRKPVFPWELQGHLPINRAEGSLRRDMYHLYRTGRLVRVAGDGARQGYRLPTPTEKLAFRLNGGVWPVGAERVTMWAS